MTEKRYRSWIAYAVVGLYVGWFILFASSDKPAEVVSHYISARAVLLIWASWLILTPISRGPFAVPLVVQASLYFFFLASGMLLPVAIHFSPVATIVLVGIFFVEQVWLIPWWKARLKRVGTQSQ
jgi:hypothetical protein